MFISLPWLHDEDEHKHKTTIFFFFFVKLDPGGGGLYEFLGGDVLLGPWNPLPIPELVQPNFAILY